MDDVPRVPIMDFFQAVVRSLLRKWSTSATPVHANAAIQTDHNMPSQGTQTDFVQFSRRTASSMNYDSSRSLDNQDFERMRAIDDSACISLLLEHINQDNTLTSDACIVMARPEGSYNHCVHILVNGEDGYVVRVPAQGTEEHWTPGDAFNMRNEVYTMKYIRKQTNVPIPQIYGWDNTLENPIGAPYIIMAAVKGVPMYDHWFAHTKDGKADRASADDPWDDIVEMRTKILKNLASAMAELRDLRFDAMGVLHFEEDPEFGDETPTVGHYLEHYGNGRMKKVPAFSHYYKYGQFKLKEWRDGLQEDAEMSDDQSGELSDIGSEDEADSEISDVEGGEDVEMTDAQRGEQAFCGFALEAMPCRQVGEGPDTFTLDHGDLDMQNIYVSSKGEITGIIDWQGALVKPRCVGYSALPLFLRKDWEDGWDMQNADHLPWVLDQYRNMYAAFMKEAIRDSYDDAQYTRNSTLYCAAYEAARDRGHDRDYFIQRMFQELPSLRPIEQEHFLARLGGSKVWAQGEHILMTQLEDLFEP